MNAYGWSPMFTGINDCTSGGLYGVGGGVEVFDAKLNGVGGGGGGLYPNELDSSSTPSSHHRTAAAGLCFRTDAVVGYGGSSAESGLNDDRGLLYLPPSSSSGDLAASHRAMQDNCRSTAALLYATNYRLQRQALDGGQMEGALGGGGGGEGTAGTGSRGDGSGSEEVTGDGAAAEGNAFPDAAMCRSTGSALKTPGDDNQEGTVQYQNNSETETG